MNTLVYTQFSKINLNDPFFNSLKSDYKEFSQWFNQKQERGEGAFIFLNDQGLLDGLLYLKKRR